MGQSSGKSPLPSAVPLFPLPNVVLFPRAVLPLHIFEERYKKMTADVLKGHRQIAMALLRPGWERDYYGRPVIEPVVCVGTILSHEKLPDGRYNFLLQGHTRAQIVEEVGDEPYRQAILHPLAETAATDIDLAPIRQKLIQLFDQPAYAALPGGMQIRQLLITEIPTAAIGDLLAFNVLPDDQTALKQSLLAMPNVQTRLNMLVDLLIALKPVWKNSPPSASVN